MANWYYSRRELAEKYLHVLGLSISPNLGIAAPRRKGKTLFLLQDVATIAKEMGYFPVYASLWQNINRPHDAVILALTEALQSLDNKFSLNKLLKAKIKRVAIGSESVGKLEIEFAENPEGVRDEDLVKIDQLLPQLIKKSKHKKILLLIDEVQHLATSDKFAPLAFSLRTMLDKRNSEVKSIMTGSSRHYMKLLFNDSQSPFYNFVEMLDFPDLGQDFLQFVANNLKSIGGVDCALPKLKKAFDSVDKSPYWMMKIVSHMLTHAVPLAESLRYTLDVIEAAEDYTVIVQGMKDIDKLLYLALASGESPFSQVVMDRIDSQTSLKGVLPNVQRSLDRMIKKHLVSRVKVGQYTIEKTGLKKHLLDDLK